MVSPDSPPSTAMSDVPSVTSSRLLHHPSSSPGSTIPRKIGSSPTLYSDMSNLSTTPLHNYCSYGPVYLFGNFFGNYTHIHPLCPSILYPNTSDPTTNVFRSYRTSSDPYRTSSDPYRTSSDPTRQVRILPALCLPATDPGAESLHQKGGGTFY